ncbi:MAG: dihydrodipicolinate synthase family protein [Candidatus Kaistia colombiensis]|nr:MAG: dihydrodipicolinate synthase family protein [Kaistia sp.]
MSTVAFKAEGVIPATLLAFKSDYSIDEAATRAHLSDVGNVRGISSVAVNGHASEVHACSFEEQRLLVELAVDEIGKVVPVTCGIYADSGVQAARIARMAQDAGAGALLLFPSQVFWMGAMSRPEMIFSHFEAVTAASDLPIIIFQYASNSALCYPVSIIEQLVDRFPQIVGIKDASYDPQTHEYLTRTLQARPNPVTMFTSHSSWLLGSLSMGAKGILSGSGSVVAALQVALFEAIGRGDLEAAKAVHKLIQPTADIFYSHPLVDMHNRMKEALVMMGKLDEAIVRPPLMKLHPEEIARVRQALVSAKLIAS